MNHFNELPLCKLLHTNLTKHGFVEPTPVQRESIPPALEGRDILATAQTGTGKTLAFAIPLIERLVNEPGARAVQALILCPTRELAIQINETFVKMIAGSRVRTAVAVGGMNEFAQLQAIRQGAQVLIATPGRLCDFLQRKLVRLDGVRFLVLDEADRMLDMGFLPSIQTIVRDIPSARQTLFFSATIDKSVQHLIDDYLREPVRVAIGPSTKPAEQVDLHLYEVEQDRKFSLLTGLLETESGSFLVFARTKHAVDRLANNLVRAGVPAARIHGARTQSQRNQALSAFKGGAHRVLVATDVAARGIHVEGIAHVVNYDLPQGPEDFIHRAGRTGRAGARGVASTFSTRSQRSDVHAIERFLGLKLNRREVAADLPIYTPVHVPADKHPNGNGRSVDLVGEIRQAPHPGVTQSEPTPARKTKRPYYEFRGNRGRGGSRRSSRSN